MIGTIHPGKGQEDLIRAVGHLSARGRSAEVALVGYAHDAYLDQLRSLATELRVFEQITVTGFVQNPYPTMATADVLVSCSRREAFGRSVVEAMLLKCAIVYPRSGGFTDYMIDGTTGLSYSPGDALELAAQLEKLLESPTLREELGRQAYLHASRLFSRAGYGDKAYKKVVELRSHPTRLNSSIGCAGKEAIAEFLSWVVQLEATAAKEAAALKAVLAEKADRICSLERHLEQLQEEMHQRAGELQTTKNDLILILDSRSWRLTAPFRAARRVFSKLRFAMRRFASADSRLIYRRVPIPVAAKIRTKSALFTVAQFLSQHTSLYRGWLKFNNSHSQFRPFAIQPAIPSDFVPAADGQIAVAMWPLRSNYDLYPYTSLLADHMESRGIKAIEFGWNKRSFQADIIHFHWPNEFFSAQTIKLRLAVWRKLLWLAAFRAKKGKLIWTAHNVWPHDRPQRKSLRLHIFLALISGVIFLNKTSRSIVCGVHPALGRKRWAPIPLVTFNDMFQIPSEPRPCGRSGPIHVGSFGLIRPYKNLASLVRAASDGPPGEMRLTIAARSYGFKNLEQELAKLAQSSQNVDLRIGHMSHLELERFVTETDAMVLPYTEMMLTSGVAIFALSKSRPVMVPDWPAMAELRRVVGADWVYCYTGALTAAKLSDFLTWLRTRDGSSRPDMSTFDCDRVAAATAQFYRSLM